MATKPRKDNSKPQRSKRRAAILRRVNERRLLEQAQMNGLQDNDPEQALARFQKLEAQGPMSMEVMRAYIAVLARQEDVGQLARVATLMAERWPSDALANLLAADGCMAAHLPVSAILFYERFLELAPSHPQVPTVELDLARLRSTLPATLDAFADDLPKELPRVASVEKIVHAVQLQRLDEATQRAGAHLKLYPDDVRVRNHLADLWAWRGDTRRALAIANETVCRSPENFFARAIRCRLSYFHGDVETCKADSKLLRSLQPRVLNGFTKAAELFAFIGDDDGIRWVMEQVERRGWLTKSTTDAAFLMAIYGTCLARSGDFKSAEKYWRNAVALDSSTLMAQQNLDDLLKPPGENWGPAYFALVDFLTPSQINEAREWFTLDGSKQKDYSARRFLKKHPEVEHLVPAMLDRGDAPCQQFAVNLAIHSSNPHVRAAIVAYARGGRGTDELRMQALGHLKRQGYDFESPGDEPGVLSR